MEKINSFFYVLKSSGKEGVRVNKERTTTLLLKEMFQVQYKLKSIDSFFFL